MSDSGESGSRRGLLAVCCGAFLAVALGYAACYVLAGFGLGVLGTPGRHVGPAVFARAALNLYAMQHVTLLGHGRIASQAGSAAHVCGEMSVPLSLWAVVPAVALIIGGFTAATISRRASRSGMIAWSVLSGIVYGLMMTAGSRIVSARIDSFLMPEFAGFGSNPPEFPFRPAAGSAFLFTGIFGVVCAYFGGVLAARSRAARESPGRWWACVKAVIVIAAIIQLPMAGYLVFLEVGKADQHEAEPTGMTGVVELIPTAAGLGYSMIHGACVTAAAESHFKPTGQTRRFFDARLTLYSGIGRNDELEKSNKALPPWVILVAVCMGGVGALAMGRLALRWGSSDGSLPTALRIALVHTTYLSLVVGFCACSLVTKDAVSMSALTVAATHGVWLAYSFLGVLILSMLGAWRFGDRFPETT